MMVVIRRDEAGIWEGRVICRLATAFVNGRHIREVGVVKTQRRKPSPRACLIWHKASVCAVLMALTGWEEDGRRQMSTGC